ncbi:hypothetical protein [Glycomyces buryatensis]|uniref:Uncharacterized protein n=1 Tax=Glycomyces buryatensis TaxID=2570927 RepID=A0A4V4HSL1_9ACTN|nr:hypothetical protein [Glycomyces buryatensis]THV41416.1 hypothetical protein FAB82_11490 [Glycomyces buryatensis]
MSGGTRKRWFIGVEAGIAALAAMVFALFQLGDGARAEPPEPSPKTAVVTDYLEALQNGDTARASTYIDEQYKEAGPILPPGDWEVVSVEHRTRDDGRVWATVRTDSTEHVLVFVVDDFTGEPAQIAWDTADVYDGGLEWIEEVEFNGEAIVPDPVNSELVAYPGINSVEFPLFGTLEVPTDPMGHLDLGEALKELAENERAAAEERLTEDAAALLDTCIVRHEAEPVCADLGVPSHDELQVDDDRYEEVTDQRWSVESLEVTIDTGVSGWTVEPAVHAELALTARGTLIGQSAASELKGYCTIVFSAHDITLGADGHFAFEGNSSVENCGWLTGYPAT